MNAALSHESTALVIKPYFDAARDVFSSCEIEPGFTLSRLAKVKFIVDPKIHNKPRHFAATMDDGLLMMFAPQFVELPVETLVAIITHEFGHAADFVYPARWYTPSNGPSKASWIESGGVDTRAFRLWTKLWEDRGRDQVEWAADGIAQAVTGKHLVYGGDCMLQRFSQGVERPKGLR